MSRYSSRNRILPVILVVVIMIVAIVGLVALARAIFFSSGSSDTTQQVDVSRDALLATSEGHAVQVTVRGPIVADENFNSYRITITPSSADRQR
jgi:flagellar basal body-associated protein FliL